MASKCEKKIFATQPNPVFLGEADRPSPRLIYQSASFSLAARVRSV